MKVIFNGKILYRKITGVERYARETLNKIDEIANTGEFILAIPESYDESILDFHNIRVMKVKGPRDGVWWDQITLPRYAKKNCGVVASFDFTTSLLWPGISTIHDMSFRRNKSFFANSWKQRMVRMKLEMYCLSAKYSRLPVFTVSNFQKQEIIELCGINASRIFVAENSWQHFEKVGYDDSVFDDYGIRRKAYYLSLSSNTPNKNFQWVYEVAKRNPDANFVIVGGKTSISIDELKSLNNLKYLGYQSDERVKSLYKDCTAFLFPSFYEGFGIPPLEALSVGAPIIVSKTSCLPEIYENSAAYIDPFDPNISLENVKLVDPKEGKRILDKYSWKTTASKWVECLRGLE
ncbi:glycosyltransferase family 4 protein [Faecalibacterium longum]|uniref:Glycosyltransferase family 1 protein n=1 Tax=Faecalibacterium longum TaxID=1851428 RepID=A0ABV1INF5_9FIRM|nr:glycosyltransferase family 1 protein [Faecalibacterium longum]MCC2182426.1 glycosyltransferase family 4 protein [Faecalibacterium longum CLA-AA-H236]